VRTRDDRGVVVRLPRPYGRSGGEHPSESGFTLVELLIVMVIMPLIIGAIAFAFVEILSQQGTFTSSVSDSADAQTVAATLDQDVRSAVMLTTNTTVQCGSSGTQLLGLEWSVANQQSGTYQTVVSYVEVPSGSTDSLVRQYCASGVSSTPTSSSTVSSDIPSTQAPPTVSFASSDTNPANPVGGWISTQGVTVVTFAITEPGSGFSYTLVGDPQTSPQTQQSTVSSNAGCGFATPGTGTYASTLCFVDLSAWNAQSSNPNVTCPTGSIGISAAVANTPYTMTFCISVQSTTSSGTAITGTTDGSSANPDPAEVGFDDIAAVSLPTYFNPPTSGAFLGNNGFYTGVPGNPAFYTIGQGSTSTITITNVQVLNSNGSPATGWDLVTGDAESTDSGESITWTTCPTITTATGGGYTGSGCTASDPNLYILPNSPTSQYGNACDEPTSANYANVDLVTPGTQSVECAATVNSDKTGTVMLEATVPTSVAAIPNLTVRQVGTGLQAIFLGLLLP